VPGLVALFARGAFEINDRRLHRIERGKHPCDRARPGIRIVWQQTRMVLRDMENDRPRLEQDEIAFFIGRNLPERMTCTMRGFLHRTERKKTNVGCHWIASSLFSSSDDPMERRRSIGRHMANFAVPHKT